MVDGWLGWVSYPINIPMILVGVTLIGFIRGYYLPPPAAFLRGFFVGVGPISLVCTGWRRGSARSVRSARTRSMRNVGDEISAECCALSAFWRLLLIIVFNDFERFTRESGRHQSLSFSVWAEITLSTLGIAVSLTSASQTRC